MKPDTISNDCQLNSSGKLIHLLGLKDLPKKHLENILDKADGLLGDKGNLKKSKTLKNMSVANLFFEPSTRTRNTFEIAAKRSSANTINVDLENSATRKNETLMDTMQTLKAMQIDMFVIRHKKNGLPHHVAANIEGVAIINAGDGINAHPTQALLDMLTIRQYKKSFENLSVAIVGDVRHSQGRAFWNSCTEDIRNKRYSSNRSSVSTLQRHNLTRLGAFRKSQERVRRCRRYHVIKITKGAYGCSRDTQ